MSLAYLASTLFRARRNSRLQLLQQRTQVQIPIHTHTHTSGTYQPPQTPAPGHSCRTFAASQTECPTRFQPRCALKFHSVLELLAVHRLVMPPPTRGSHISGCLLARFVSGSPDSFLLEVCLNVLPKPSSLCYMELVSPLSHTKLP